MLFYLKQVVLALKQRAKEEGEITGNSRSARCEEPATETFRGILREGSVDEEALCVWREKLATEGIQVLVDERCPDDDKEGMMENHWELSAPEKAMPEIHGELLPAAEAMLWIADDPDAARRMEAEGKAVLGYLPADHENADFSGIRYLAENLTELDGDYLDKIYRRYHGIPWDILETEHCLLRETTEEDVDAFYRIYAHPSVTAYMEDLFPDRDQELAYTRDYIKNIYEFYGFGVWTVILRETGEVIGRAGLSYREGFEEPELGFLVGVPWQGKGLATEICRAVLEFGKEELGFTKVIAFAEPENAASNHILKKLGFREREKVLLLGKNHARWEK